MLCTRFRKPKPNFVGKFFHPGMRSLELVAERAAHSNRTKVQRSHFALLTIRSHSIEVFVHSAVCWWRFGVLCRGKGTFSVVRDRDH